MRTRPQLPRPRLRKAPALKLPERGRLPALKLPELGKLPALKLPDLSKASALTLADLRKPLALKRPSGPVRRNRVAKDVVGLDIQPGYVAAVQVHVNGGVRVQRAAGVPLALDVVREGEVLDAGALTDALRNLFTESGLDRNVRIGLANQRTVLRTIELPAIENAKELAAAVRFRAEDEIPMALSNAVLDFHPLGVADTPQGIRQRIVLVAAQRDMVEGLLEAARGAGLRPVGVDLSAFAMIRSLYRGDSDPATPTVYLSVGGVTNLAIARGSTCGFTRVLGNGIEDMAASLANRRSIGMTEARRALFQAGLDVQDGDSRFSVVEDQLIAEDARSILVSGVREIAGEVRGSLDFQRTQAGDEPAGELVLSGPSLDIPGFAAALQSEVGLPVRPGTVQGVKAGSFGSFPAQRMAIATGLAVEEIRA